MNTDLRRLLFKTIQYAIGVVALVWLVQQIEWSRVMDMISHMSYGVAALILVVTCIELLCRFSMWHVLINGLHRTPFVTAARVNLTVSFVNQIIPSRVSGRSVAPVVLRYHTDYSWSDVVSVTGLHTALYALLNGGVALIGLILFISEFSYGLIVILGISVALYIIVGPMIIMAGLRIDSTANILVRVGERFSGLSLVGSFIEMFSQKLPSFTEDTANTFRQLVTDVPVIVLYSVGWAGGMMIIPGIRTWLLLGTLNVEFSPVLLLPVALVTAYSVTLLPLTPGGIGVAEATATLVFVALGVPAAVIAPVILIDRLLGVYIPSLIGWYPTLKIDLQSYVRTDS
jgi:uncharacterized protein (TIRG00374 family)